MNKNIKNQAFLTKQKKLLLSEKNRVEEELKAINKMPSYGDSDEANAQEIERFEGYKGMEKELKQLLKEVNKALNLLENGKYGICQNCGNQTEKDRLQAFPAANTCIKCSRAK